MSADQHLHADARGARAPGPSSRELVDFFFARRRDPLDALHGLHRKHGPLVRIATRGNEFYSVTAPGDLRHVLVDNARNYSKDITYGRLAPIMGRGLFTNDPPSWIRQRRLVQPAFSRERTEAYGALMRTHAARLAERWSDEARRGGEVDVAADMMRLTLDIVVETVLGSEAGAFRERVRTAVDELIGGLDQRALVERVVETLPGMRGTERSKAIARRIPTETNRRFEAARQDLDDLAYRLIAERRRALAPDGDERDMLSLLLRARDEDGGMTDVQIRDEVITMLLSGHETSAVALAWTFLVLSRFPDVDARVAAEVRRELGSGPATPASLPRLTYARRVVDEVLRLYPPVWRLTRTVIGPDALGGYPVPKGAVVMVIPYLTHRLEEHWDNPEGFDPERFLPQRFASIDRFAYAPFGAGPRACIGRDFAVQEALTILATIAARVRLALVPGQRVEVDPRLTLRPKHPMRMRVHPRAEALS